MNCRHCNSELNISLIDLGSSPPSNAYLTEQSLRVPEKWFPLRVLVCSNCWLVQTDDFAGVDELFLADYAYFSSYSATWLKHAESYAHAMIERFKLNNSSQVVEIAANDGYLLQYFKALNIPNLGIEPTAGTAAAARLKGIRVIEGFFSLPLAKSLIEQGIKADLMVANNVLAHVPNINDFVQAFALLLKPKGVATFEFPHLLRLIAGNQFDTIYHEHFSYLSLTPVINNFNLNGLEVFDVEELETHGGSLRVFAQKSGVSAHAICNRLEDLLDRERNAGMTTIEYYSGFQTKANAVKNDLLALLLKITSAGKRVIAYGAAAKGNTLINYAGIRPDIIRFVADINPAKQGKFMPGSRIPIYDDSRIRAEKPDYVLILPWNIRSEVVKQLSYIRKWGGRFVTAVPALRID